MLLTEAGFPSIPAAARAPWREERVAADVWLQARCYEATLRALARRPWIEGVVLLALGAHLVAAASRPLARHRRQAGQLHDGELVRRGSDLEIERRRQKRLTSRSDPLQRPGTISKLVVRSMSCRIECQTEQYLSRESSIARCTRSAGTSPFTV